MTLDAAFQGLLMLFSFSNILLMLFGVILGLVFGVLPGLGGLTTLAILIPFVYGMDPVGGLALLLGAHGAIYFGGSVTAILINTPGTGESAASCFDGYPMTQKGQGARALGVSACSSTLGGLFGVIVLIGSVPFLRMLIFSIGAPEYFLLALVGIAIIGMLQAETRIKGLLSGSIGLLLAFVGYDPVSGVNRFTFGNIDLYDGLEGGAVIIGLFALAEMMRLFRKGASVVEKAELINALGSGVWDGIKDVFRYWPLMLRSSAIGAIIGLIPGLGGTVANFVAYGQAQQTSKRPELFGTGIPEGLIAVESANNAKEGGSLVPTVAFGIPGSAGMAVLMGALFVLGITPGPEMLTKDLPLVFSMAWTVAFSCIFASIIGVACAKYFVKLTVVKPEYLVPVVVVISLMGAFALNNSFLDVILAATFAILGYLFKKFGYSNACIIVGVMLGSIAERNLALTRQAYGWSFLTRPLAIVLMALVVLVIVWPVIQEKRRQNRGAESNGGLSQ